MKWSDLAYFFIGVIIPTYNFVDWIVSHFGKAIKRMFVRTEQDLIVWTHYEKHALKEGHSPKTPRECEDDGCATIK